MQLLLLGADQCRVSCKSGEVPLEIATRQGHVSISQVLLAHGGYQLLLDPRFKERVLSSASSGEMTEVLHQGK
mgnify:FL=1